MGPESGGLMRRNSVQDNKIMYQSVLSPVQDQLIGRASKLVDLRKQKISKSTFFKSSTIYQLLALISCALGLISAHMIQQQQAPESKADTARRHSPTLVGRLAPQMELSAGQRRGQLQLSHHVLCEPISQLNDLKLTCASENQFMVILEAYYSDLYPEIVCKLANEEAKLNKLTGSQLIAIMRQLSSESKPLKDNNEKDLALIKFQPTLSKTNKQQPFCLDDMRHSFQAKCSGRQRCSFSRETDHQFPACVNLKPGHVFLRYLCVDEALLIKYCNADALLASHTSTLNRVKRAATRPLRQLWADGTADAPQIDTRDFGFVASPGYPNFYATPRDAPSAGSQTQSDCGWTIEAELGQRVTLKLLDASLAPHDQHEARQPELTTTTSLLLPFDLAEESTSPADLQLLELATADKSQNGTNVHFELEAALGNETNTEGRRIVFKINELDYQVLKVNVAAKLQQVASMCQGYDQLVVRDSNYLSNNGSNELELISNLPISLYRSNLIDFKNKSIYHRLALSKANELKEDKHHYHDDNTNEAAPSRLDYQALIGGLNPIQLSWLYQHNVTLCSTSQQEHLLSNAATSLWSKISFTSTGNTIQLDLLTGHTFNPTNRGLLFWYQKHGCAATKRAPSRSKLVFRNESTEIFKCFQGFVFDDTRQSLRVRHCSPLDQSWLDADTPTLNAPSSVLPACVYVEELASSLAAMQQLQLKQDPHSSPNALRAIANGSPDVAVEVVGVTLPEVDLFSGHNSLSAYNQPLAASTLHNKNQTTAGWWNNMLDYMSILSIEDSNSEIRSITTHQPLREQRLNERDFSFWSRAAALFDRRLIAPAIAVLLLFVLINLIIYVIFLIALPKFANFLCFNRKQRCSNKNNNHHQYESSNKLSHYELDYSVTMGMSL